MTTIDRMRKAAEAKHGTDTLTVEQWLDLYKNKPPETAEIETLKRMHAAEMEVRVYRKGIADVLSQDCIDPSRIRLLAPLFETLLDACFEVQECSDELCKEKGLRPIARRRKAKK